MSDQQQAPTQAQSKQRRASVLSHQQQQLLEKSLSSRPSVGSLQAHGIAKDGGRFAAEKARLSRALASHAVSRDLSDRPAAAELAHAGILPQTGVAPALAGVAKRLSQALLHDKLNHQLYARESGASAEDAERLMRANDVAPRLRQAKLALEHAITRDRVGAKLEVRPDAQQLLHTGILSSPVSARLAGVQRELNRRFTADRVGHLLEQRRDVSSLARDGVLRESALSRGVAPALQGVQRALEHNLAKSNLFHALQWRPSVQELRQQGIWQPAPGLDQFHRPEVEVEDEEEDEEEQQQQQAQQRSQQQQQQQQQASPMDSIAAAESALHTYWHQQALERQADLERAELQARSNQVMLAWQAEQQQAVQQAQRAAIAQQQAQAAAVMAQQQAAASAAAYSAPFASFASFDPSSSGAASSSSSSARRSKSFHLTRLLLKAAASMGDSGELSPAQRSLLKELIVDGAADVFDAAEEFDQTNDLYAFKATLLHLAQRR